MTPLAYARGESRRSLSRLEDLLRIPSVSAVAEHAGDMRRAADWVAARARDAGFPTVRVDETQGHPIVLATWECAPDAPTLLIYGHYDVQPADPVHEWDTPPFEPTVRDGRIYARGASDDKGQLLTHLEAVSAFRQTRGEPPLNIKLLVEGEEEIGSPNLAAWIGANTVELAADAAVVSDTAMVSADQPGIVVGLRGLTYLDIVARGPNRDLHSGQFGGAVLNPALALCSLLAGLLDGDGRVTVPGFYDRVRPLTEADRAEIARVPFDEAAYRTAAGGASGWGEKGYTTPERIGARPSLDVNGLVSGWTGSGAKTVLPAEARAKLSMRLVPDQDPDEIADIVADHLRRLAPTGLDLSVTSLHGCRPALVDRDTAALRAASAAMARAFGAEPVLQREGGSIPVVSDFDSLLGLPTVLMGFGLPDDNLHAPNEKMDLDCFFRGIEADIAFYELLAAAGGSA